ncbi:mast cell protease 3-like isoform X1 [Chelonoidis abingdonii]|uniref:mast cell protease 3-like isoform X1 n=1 Tax=Chelonoidis abingdonii TaxID=106734 RepID=UPI0013F20018|nr:mast cell protease 3-like [Chelonoidis abingdonii]
MQLLLLFPMIFPLPPRSQAGEIIGGQEARPHSRPYMAFVKIQREGKGENMCGGFLIREDVVVTAAHCNCNLGNISVLLGAHNFEIDELGTQTIWVRRRIPHPEFNNEKFENDIMLLQLRDKAELTQTVGTILLSQKKVKKGAVCSVAGWGQTSIKTNAKPSPTLQEVELTVMGKRMCLSQPILHYVPSRMLCVGDPQERKAPFLGDSGSPLVCDGKAQGIVSHGTGDWSTPSVFTRLSKYVCWIKNTLHKLKP